MKTIEQFKKENPIYQNEPDVKLADFIYNKYYKNLGVDENAFYKKAFPEVSELKTKELESKMIPEVDSFIDPDSDLINQDLAQFFSFKPKVKDIALTTDVGVNEGADPEARFAASLGYDEANKQLAIKNVLSDLYKTDVEVRVGNRTGELEYLNPKTKKYELVNKPGVDLGDLTGMSADALIVGADMVATLATTAFTGANLPAGIGVGAITAGAGEYYKYILGKQLYGINKDVSDKELLNRAFQAAAISGGSAVLGVGAAKLIKGVQNIIKGRFIKPNDIVDSKNEIAMSRATEVSDKINDALDAAKIKANLKYTLGEITNNGNLLAKQKLFETSSKLGRIGEFTDIKKNQAQALNSYFGYLKTGFDTTDGRVLNEFDAGKLIQDSIRKQNDPIRLQLKTKQQEAEDVLENAILNLPNGNRKEVGVSIRTSIDDIAEDYKVKVEQAAKALDEAAGMKFINTDVIKPAIKKLTDKEKENLINVNKIESIFKDKILFDKNPIANKQLTLFDNIIENDKIPIKTARNTLSSMKAIVREKATGSATGETPEVGAINFVIKNLEEQLRKDAPKSYIDALDEFNDIVITNKQKLNNETISKITLDRDGKPFFLEDDLFELTFKKGIGSAKAAKETFEVIKNSPDAMKGYKDMIYQKYKEDVIDTGLTINKHKRFLKDYESPLKLFFNEKELKKIEPIGGLKKLVDKTTEVRKQTLNDLRRSFGGKLEEMTPGNLVNKIYRSNDLNDIRELKKILKNDSEVYQAFQRNVLSDMSESVMKFDSNLGLKKLDSKAFTRYLEGDSGERGYQSALREIFNQEFVDNLFTLNEALQIAARTRPARGEGILGNALTDIIRANLGQFTFEGRLLTAGRRIFKGTSDRIFANALANPESLKDLIRLREIPRRSKEAIAIFSKLGGNIFIESENDPLPIRITDDLGN
jgi:hypothetical protein